MSRHIPTLWPQGDGAQDAFDRMFDEILEGDEERVDAFSRDQSRKYNPPHCEQCGARCMWFEVQGKFLLHDPKTGDPHQCKFGVTIDLAGLTPYEFDEDGQRILHQPDPKL